jgi:phage recombination protein Bet
MEHKSVLITMASRFGMEPAAFEQTLRATVVPQNVSKEQFAAFLLVCQHYNLNPILKEIHGFPAKSGGIQPIVGVDGWANLVNSHPQCDGFTFEDQFEHGEMVAITCKMYRKDRSHAVEATEYMEECKRDTETWRKWPRRMLRHKALIQAARYCFGFAGLIDPDEWERSPENEINPSPPRRGRPPATVVQSTPVTNGGSRPLPPTVQSLSATVEKEVAGYNDAEAVEDPPPPTASAPEPPPPFFAETQQTVNAQYSHTVTVEQPSASQQVGPPKKRGRPPQAPTPAQEVEFNSALWAEGCMRALRYADDPAEIPKIEHERINPHLSEASPPDIEEVMAVLYEVKVSAGLA